MSYCARPLQAPFAVLIGFALSSVGGCVYEQQGPPKAHFGQFSTKPPEGDTVTVCHAYGCKAQTPFSFTSSDIAEISAVMMHVRRVDSPSEERRAIAYAISWMERRVAPTVGTASDQPSISFLGSGDESQQDCVDEATNTTSYLLVLERHGLIQHHMVERPFAKDDLSHWTHWAALIREKESGERFAIVYSSGAYGENPTVQSATSFYIPDGPYDNKPPERSGYATTDPDLTGFSYSGSDTGSIR